MGDGVNFERDGGGNASTLTDNQYPTLAMLTDQTIDPNAQKPSALKRPFIAIWHWMVPPTQAHKDRESRSAVILRSSLVIGFTVLFVGGVLFYGRDMRDVYQDWRADRMVR